MSATLKPRSPRIKTIWCPNVTTHDFDPRPCWPEDALVDCVAQDFCLQKVSNHPGDFAWFRDEPRGLKWAAEFAAAKGKPFALSEWGMDDDAFVGDFKAAAAWLKSRPQLDHHCWWDRGEVIDCRISNGRHPKLGAAYKAAFA